MSHTTTSAMLQPSRKVFNTFIDDGALISGVRRNARDGIKRMIKDGSINLFVPLHTLDRLRRLSKGNDRLSRDAAEALRWLDKVTSTTDRVNLQGGFEIYEKWEEVEKYMLPDTLLSMEQDYLSADSVADDIGSLSVDGSHHDLSDKASLSSSETLDRMSIKSSPMTSYSGPAAHQKEKVLAPIGTGRPSHNKTASDVSVTSTSSTRKGRDDRIPYSLRPFFNHIIWRIHHEQNADVAMESFILVTNDELKQNVAKRFGIRAKSLDQLRKIVARENKDYKTRLGLMEKESLSAPLSKLALQEENSPKANGDVCIIKEKVVNDAAGNNPLNSDDEDEVVFKRDPPKAPHAMASGRQVFDANHFGRSEVLPNGANHRSNRFHTPNHSPRGGRNGRSPGTFRGRGGFRGNFAPSLISNSLPLQQAELDLSQPIDPDSFARPTPNGRFRGRGGQRRLWEPS